MNQITVTLVVDVDDDDDARRVAERICDASPFNRTRILEVSDPLRRATTFAKKIAIGVELAPITYDALALLGTSRAVCGENIANDDRRVVAALEHLASSAQQGVVRPGAWERGWIVSAFGDEWADALEQDETAQWRRRAPRVAPKR